MGWPKRARTADWESGVLTLDGEERFEVPELTAELMERLAGHALAGSHVKDYPVTDELIAPFAGHRWPGEGDPERTQEAEKPQADQHPQSPGLCVRGAV